MRVVEAARWAAFMAAFAGCTAASSDAFASPEFSVGATTGIALADLRTGPVVPAFHLGGRADLLFLRNRPLETAFGPYLEFGTIAFETFEFGGGGSWLVPGLDLPLVVSAGAFARSSVVGVEPGVVANLFWGSRSYNFHSRYGMAFGLFGEARAGLGASRSMDAVLGVRVDLAALALPFLLAYQALRH